MIIFIIPKTNYIFSKYVSIICNKKIYQKMWMILIYLIKSCVCFNKIDCLRTNLLKIARIKKNTLVIAHVINEYVNMLKCCINDYKLLLINCGHISKLIEKFLLKWIFYLLKTLFKSKKYPSKGGKSMKVMFKNGLSSIFS